MASISLSLEKVIDIGEVGVKVQPGECKAEDGVLHQHKVLRGLVFQVLPDLSSGEVPHLLERIEMLKLNQKVFHLDESVHTARDQILTIRTECCRLDVGLGSELDLPEK